MATQEHTPLPHRTYADKIERDFPGEEHSWLVQMLRNGYDKGHRGGGCTIHVVDPEVDYIIRKRFDLPRRSDVGADFREILGRPLSENGVRFVVVAYGDLYDLNFSYVDYIALALDLEPSFLFAHFERARGKSEGPFRDRAPALLPSDTRHLEFIYPIEQNSLYSNMAVTQSVSSAAHVRTTTIFKQRSLGNYWRPWVGEEDSPLEMFLKNLSQPQLQSFSVQEDQSALRYLTPFFRAWALQHATQLALLDGAIESENTTPGYLHRCWKSNRLCMKALESVVRNLSKYIHARQDPSSGIEVLFQEYTTLLQMSRDQSQEITSFTQQMGALESIRESQKGVQSAESVRRLTLVAFVFIPLTFATSFFGMNVRQLGTGSIHVGFFVLTALTAGFLSMGLAYGLGPWERAVTRRKERFATDIAIDINQVTFADIVRYSKSGQRLLGKLDPSFEVNATFHDAIFFWARSQIRGLRAWAMSFRENRHRNEAAPNRNSLELTPIA